MTTLISWQDGGGSKGRCDARCHNAKRQKCECICGGRNHGVGLKQAAKNTKDMLKILDQDRCRVNTEAIQQILAQQDLFHMEL